MRYSPFALLGAAALAAGAVHAQDPATLDSDYDELQPLAAHRQISVALVDRLRNHHFKQQSLDDETSSRIFEQYLDILDSKRVLFLASDVAELEKHRTTLDEALVRGELAGAFEIYNLYQRRELQRLAYEFALLQGGLDQFDFTEDDVIDLDREDAPRPATRAAAEKLWRLGLKSRILAGKLAGDSLELIEDTLTKRVKNRLRMVRQTRSEDVFRVYANAFTRTYDKHTTYLSPRDKDEFDIHMSLSLEGIGAVLGLVDEYTVVQSLVKGGPADLGGELKQADRIIAVSQSANEPFVDIVGWRTSDVVTLIRGPKGSPVLLKVIPASVPGVAGVAGVDGGETREPRVVEIVRNVVNLEDQSAQKTLFSLNRDGSERRIGIVTIPTFYLDFNASQAGDPNARSTTRDVARLIDELKRERIDGLIVDLRNNGGGSMQEAVDLTGLFIETGPVVQVTNRLGRRDRFGDPDRAVAWGGPLAVMVNQLSASASEIFAAAVQDYGIGVVVGTTTFGKGTVQILVPVPSGGQVKLTERQYWRISGHSTEPDGVAPDIVYPSPAGRGFASPGFRHCRCHAAYRAASELPGAESGRADSRRVAQPPLGTDERRPGLRLSAQAGAVHCAPSGAHHPVAQRGDAQSREAGGRRAHPRDRKQPFRRQGRRTGCHHGRAPRTQRHRGSRRIDRAGRPAGAGDRPRPARHDGSFPAAGAGGGCGRRRGGAVGRTPQSTASASERLAMALANAVSNAAKGMVVCSLTP